MVIQVTASVIDGDGHTAMVLGPDWSRDCRSQAGTVSSPARPMSGMLLDLRG
jgi:hypothetical protein